MTATTQDANVSESQSAPQNLLQLLRQRVGAAPQKDFLFSESDGRRFTYTQFEQAVNLCCQAAAVARRRQTRSRESVNA